MFPVFAGVTLGSDTHGPGGPGRTLCLYSSVWTCVTAAPHVTTSGPPRALPDPVPSTSQQLSLPPPRAFCSSADTLPPFPGLKEPRAQAGSRAGAPGRLRLLASVPAPEELWSSG